MSLLQVQRHALVISYIVYIVFRSQMTNDIILVWMEKKMWGYMSMRQQPNDKNQ